MMSEMWVSRSTSRDSRWLLSPMPVNVGVNTAWPRFISTSRTRFQHQLPCQAPVTKTNVVISSPPRSGATLAVKHRSRNRASGTKTSVAGPEINFLDLNIDKINLCIMSKTKTQDRQQLTEHTQSRAQVVERVRLQQTHIAIEGAFE